MLKKLKKIRKNKIKKNQDKILKKKAKIQKERKKICLNMINWKN